MSVGSQEERRADEPAEPANQKKAKVDDLASVLFALDKSECARIRAETDLRVVQTKDRNYDKLYEKFLEERALWRQEKGELLASLQEAKYESARLEIAVRDMRCELQQMARLRKEAEEFASIARIEFVKQDCEAKMRVFDLSPVRTADDVLLGTAPALTQRNDNNHEQERSLPQNVEHVPASVPDVAAEVQAEQDEIQQCSPIAPRAKMSPLQFEHHAREPDTKVVENFAPLQDANHGEKLVENDSEGRTGIPKSPPSGGVAPIVCLSGYRDNNSVCKLRLSRAIESLGGQVFLGRDLNDCITHIVSPANGQKTVRTLAAELMQKWCVSDEWVIQSLKAGKFVEESPFGKRSNCEKKPFAQTLFYLHSTFVQNPKHEEKVRLARQLIGLAGGQIVDASHNVEPTYRLVSKDHGKIRPSDLFWSDLMAMLQGPGGDEQPPRKSTPSKKRQRKLNFDDEGAK